MRDPLTYESGDLRALARHLQTRATTLVRNQIETIVKDELEETAKRLRRATSADVTSPRRVAYRSGDLFRTIDTTLVRSPFKIRGEVGFLKVRDEKDVIKSFMHTRLRSEPYRKKITAQSAQKLAFPVRGLSPRAIIDSTGQHMTVREAREHWDEIRFTKNAILGRMKGQRSWTFLFLRRRSVEVKRRIDLDKEADLLQSRIERRLDKEI